MSILVSRHPIGMRHSACFSLQGWQQAFAHEVFIGCGYLAWFFSAQNTQFGGFIQRSGSFILVVIYLF
jgi:hypothetical protein